MIRVCCWLKPLVISSVPPPRSTIATSSAPAISSTARNPSLIEKMPINTATTPAMPTTATSAVPRRWPMLRRFIAVIETACFNNDIDWSSSSAPQLLDDLEPPNLRARQSARQRSEPDGEQCSDHEGVWGHEHQRQILCESGADGARGRVAAPETERAADHGDSEPLEQHQRDDAAVRKSDGAHHGDLAHALAHRLRHRVCGYEQHREEHRGRDCAHDRADVAHHVRVALEERAFGRRLGLG